MKHTYIFLATSVILALSAFYLALHQIGGWGWFLFGSIVTFVYPKNTKYEDD